MRWCTDHVLPRLTDRLLSTDEVHALRSAACVELHGEVLEIGFGSGLNVQHYPAAVGSVAAVEPSAWMLHSPCLRR